MAPAFDEQTDFPVADLIEEVERCIAHLEGHEAAHEPHSADRLARLRAVVRRLEESDT